MRDDESPLTGDNTPESWSGVKECWRTKPIYRCSDVHLVSNERFEAQSDIKFFRDFFD